MQTSGNEHQNISMSNVLRTSMAEAFNHTKAILLPLDMPKLYGFGILCFIWTLMEYPGIQIVANVFVGTFLPILSSLLPSMPSVGGTDTTVLLLQSRAASGYYFLAVPVVIALMFVATIGRCVLFSSVIEGNVLLFGYIGKNFRRAMSFFGWCLLVAIIMSGLILIPLFCIRPYMIGGPAFFISPGFILYVLYFLIVYAVYLLYMVYICDIVIPAMFGMDEDTTIWTASSETIYEYFKGHVKDFFLYICAKFCLWLTITIITQIAFILILLLIGLCSTLIASCGCAPLAILLVIFFMFSYFALISPCSVYLRSFELLVVGKIFPQYKMLPKPVEQNLPPPSIYPYPDPGENPFDRPNKDYSSEPDEKLFD